VAAEVQEGSGDDIMDMAAALGEGKLMAVVILEGFEQTGLGGDHVVHFKVVE
jgi:hypothetical protein